MPYTNRWSWQSLAATALHSVVGLLNESLAKLAQSYNTHKHGPLDLEATGTPDATTAYFGDGSWQVPGGAGPYPAEDVAAGEFGANVGGGAYVFPGKLDVAASLGWGAVENGNSGAAKTIDWATGNYQQVILTANCTFTFLNPPKGILILDLLQDSVGAWLVTWPGINWMGGVAPTLTTTPFLGDVIWLIWTGTSYLGAIPDEWSDTPPSGGPPSAHATTHQDGGSDELSVLLLGGFPGGTSNFLRADGSFSAPVASVADPNQQAYAPGAFTLVTGKYAIMARRLTLTSTQRVVGQGTACLREI